MSDLSMYELEDIIWDDLDRGDDHIVPHSSNARSTRKSFEGDSCKKPRREATSVLSNAGNLGKSERDTKTLDHKKKNMIEKESSSHTPPDVFSASCDGEIVKDMPNLASDDTRNSDKCFKNSYVTSGNALSVDDRGLSLSATSASYPLTHISQPQESGDLLYYGWPDIGNFEDVDKMLRSCDSSFGLGVTDNEHELGWFTSDQIGGSTEEALKMDFKFPCPESSALSNMLPDNASNHGHVMESCGDLSFEGTASAAEVDKQKQGFQPFFVGSPTKMGTMFQASKENKVENKKDVGLEKGISVEMGSLSVPESSSISSELSEISLEATSFRQLQQVMGQLDLRTKLCIRDSLYRLARSAEQRHNNPSAIDINDIGGPLMADTTNNGLIDMETDTNPIDRSVAHLLFHRP